MQTKAQKVFGWTGALLVILLLLWLIGIIPLGRTLAVFIFLSCFILFGFSRK